ncbi:hypothetical protein ASA1KI_03020 [Opitutales bacterium ASA1]|uniref:hypothetical protein n=1 Tax=Congregicoccus parvus TaxID=3081749 RepID=UPI002B2F6F8E|nr:hypothetical protein ASA1KI_03020 [Opitutales bacterium ASA1]
MVSLPRIDLRVARLRPLFLLAVAVCGLGIGADRVSAQNGGSPFLPPGFGAAPAPPPAASPLDTIELRAVLTLDGKTHVTLFDTNGNKSFTAVVGESVNNIHVADYDYSGGDDAVTLRSGAATRRVTLKKAKIVALATPPPNAVPLPAGATPPPPGQPAANAVQPATGAPSAMPQMSDEEVRRRMQNVAEEIRRRRALRREQMENAQPPGSP